MVSTVVQVAAATTTQHGSLNSLVAADCIKRRNDWTKPLEPLTDYFIGNLIGIALPVGLGMFIIALFALIIGARSERASENMKKAGRILMAVAGIILAPTLFFGMLASLPNC